MTPGIDHWILYFMPGLYLFGPDAEQEQAQVSAACDFAIEADIF